MTPSPEDPPKDRWEWVWIGLQWAIVVLSLGVLAFLAYVGYIVYYVTTSIEPAIPGPLF